ncbi:hypothetical protein PTQ21_21675 [Paenibacillus marchantiae]|uniref:hypothetical protein n=1 Tax=Paenibacillus marchantiae TaxID=3026433 RepID=UPI00237BB9B2|nr:hypothetical protein [Paenibacillus marchantiae]WDQ31020.1 hypothetical protein PTQ21_21675 [Paenibacillus marchantiae]
MYAIRVGSSVQRYRYSGEARGDFAARMIAVFRPDGTLLVEGQFAIRRTSSWRFVEEKELVMITGMDKNIVANFLLDTYLINSYKKLGFIIPMG